VVPFIANEEEKIERETRKILGRLNGGRIAPGEFAVSAQCHRVNVVDGHMAAVRVKLARAAEPAEVREAFASFTALPQELRLPTPRSAPSSCATSPIARSRGSTRRRWGHEHQRGSDRPR